MDLSSAVGNLTRWSCGAMRLPSVSPEKGSIISVTPFMNPQHSSMMPCEAVCRQLRNQLFQLNETKPDGYGAGFLFGKFTLEALDEFIVMHEAKAVSMEVYVL